MEEQNLLMYLEETYPERCTNSDLRREAWGNLVRLLPPCCPDTPVPFLITSRSGDLGLAMQWIVQTAVIRPMLDRIMKMTDLPPALTEIIRSVDAATVGAMAHTEKQDDPMVYRFSEDGLSLSGTKNYITGGEDARLILMTARAEGEAKPSALILLPAGHIPTGALKSIPRKNLLTVPHGILKLEGLRINREQLLILDGSDLRRHMAAAPLFERALVMEAWAGLAFYLLEKAGRGQSLRKPLLDLVDAAEKHYIAQKETFANHGRVTPFIPDIGLVTQAGEEVMRDKALRGKPGMAPRVEDLGFLLSLLPGRK